MELTKKQQEAYTLIECTNSLVFLTGKPGTGKSVVINKLRESGKKDYVFGAPTGLAANNINGKTLHSIFRIPSSEGVIPPDFDNFPEINTPTYNFLKYKLHCLVIDEVSMLRVDLFEYIDRELRFIKDKNEPFGGVQVICVGDFYQLPPVTKSGFEVTQLREMFGGMFVFQSKLWQLFKVIELKQVLRQKDAKFVNILNSARTLITDNGLKELNKRVIPLDSDELCLTIVPTNAQADSINRERLSEIMGDEKIYEAEFSGDWPQFPCEVKLTLKIGAHVLVKKNNADKTDDGEYSGAIVNGTLGKIVSMQETFVTIELEDGSWHHIYTQTFNRAIKQRTEVGYVEQIIASFTQIPLALAWAISIHKSQGQTYDRVHIYPHRMFAAGQLYVALSRSRSLQGMTFESRVEKKHFITNMAVKRYYQTL